MKKCRIPKPTRNEKGMAIPTINPFLRPSVATTSTITSITAVIILPSSSETISPANFVVSNPG